MDPVHKQSSFHQYNMRYRPLILSNFLFNLSWTPTCHKCVKRIRSRTNLVFKPLGNVFNICFQEILKESSQTIGSPSSTDSFRGIYHDIVAVENDCYLLLFLFFFKWQNSYSITIENRIATHIKRSNRLWRCRDRVFSRVSKSIWMSCEVSAVVFAIKLTKPTMVESSRRAQ